MTVCFSLAGLYKCWIFLKSNQKTGLGQTKIPLNFKSGLNQCLDTKKIIRGFTFTL